MQEVSKASAQADAARAQAAERERLQGELEALHAEHHRVLGVLTARNNELENTRVSLQEHVRSPLFASALTAQFYFSRTASCCARASYTS